MDAAASHQATLFGVSEGGNMTTVFATTYPKRVRSIVLAGCFVCRARKPDWPHGISRSEFENFVSFMEKNWGDATGFLQEVAASVAEDPEEQAFMSRLLTQSASPSSMAKITRLNYEIDIRPILTAVTAPTLVLFGERDLRVELAQVRYLADNLPNSRFEIVKDAEHLPWIGPVDRFVDLITGFALSKQSAPAPETVLTSILITDIVGATAASVAAGDAAWLRTIEAHDTAAARAVARHDGGLVKSLGDGILATFSGPSRAVACARNLQETASELGLEIRAAVHSGECFRRGADVSGLSVNIAARIVDATPRNEIWVSGTVRDLVVGSELRFVDVGRHTLKGVPGDWELHRVQEV